MLSRIMARSISTNSFCCDCSRGFPCRLPGDFRFRLLGRAWFIPVTSTVVMSVVVGVIARLI